MFVGFMLLNIKEAPHQQGRGILTLTPDSNMDGLVVSKRIFLQIYLHTNHSPIINTASSEYITTGQNFVPMPLLMELCTSRASCLIGHVFV